MKWLGLAVGVGVQVGCVGLYSVNTPALLAPFQDPNSIGFAKTYFIIRDSSSILLERGLLF